MANEVRLIDADILKQRFDEREAEDIELYGAHIAECFSAAEAKEIVDNVPAVDAVDVVRCKDCVWLHDGFDMYCCQKHTGLVLIKPDGSSFCSYGERRGKG